MNKQLQAVAAKAQNRMYNWAEASRDERGAAGVEYGLLVALIAAVIIATVKTLGTQINTAFTTITSAL
jgi:pilus assembly protein Flp/PilA